VGSRSQAVPGEITHKGPTKNGTYPQFCSQVELTHILGGLGGTYPQRSHILRHTKDWTEDLQWKVRIGRKICSGMSIPLTRDAVYANANSRAARDTIVAEAIRDMRDRYPAMSPPRYRTNKSEDPDAKGRGKLLLICSQKKESACAWHVNAYTSKRAPKEWAIKSLDLTHTCYTIHPVPIAPPGPGPGMPALILSEPVAPRRQPDMKYEVMINNALGVKKCV